MFKLKNRFNRFYTSAAYDSIDFETRANDLRYKKSFDYDPHSGKLVMTGKRDFVAEINNVADAMPSNHERILAFQNGDIYALGCKKGVYTDVTGAPTNIHEMMAFAKSLRKNATAPQQAVETPAVEKTSESEVNTDESK